MITIARHNNAHSLSLLNNGGVQIDYIKYSFFCLKICV